MHNVKAIDDACMPAGVRFLLGAPQKQCINNRAIISHFDWRILYIYYAEPSEFMNYMRVDFKMQ